MGLHEQLQLLMGAPEPKIPMDCGLAHWEMTHCRDSCQQLECYSLRSSDADVKQCIVSSAIALRVAAHVAKRRLSRHSMLLINGHNGSRSVGASTPVVVLSSAHHKIVLGVSDACRSSDSGDIFKPFESTVCV